MAPSHTVQGRLYLAYLSRMQFNQTLVSTLSIGASSIDHRSHIFGSPFVPNTSHDSRKCPHRTFHWAPWHCLRGAPQEMGPWGPHGLPPWASLQQVSIGSASGSLEDLSEEPEPQSSAKGTLGFLHALFAHPKAPSVCVPLTDQVRKADRQTYMCPSPCGKPYMCPNHCETVVGRRLVTLRRCGCGLLTLAAEDEICRLFGT